MGGPIVAAVPHGPVHEHEDKGVMFDRITKSGRHLWYVLKVIQQPERARACGSGPKSSADRRPVDPPPVVELRIFEGATFEQAQNKDITFLYNANFFLYATLEHARVMAHGRVQAPAVNTPPVLTGVPVSGMAYLDRPKEAGYFLFPDLSVRHEGRYRFNFNLYEETKEEKDRSEGNLSPADGLNPAIGGTFDWIMEVKTQDFLVYSAKKFPGLTESTALSRVVAEQGCRVRIRRDVRMRRRPGKEGGDNYENAEEEYNRRRRTETPEAQREAYRARSMSGSAERTPYSADSQRRGSVVEYPPPPPPPHYHHPQTPTSNAPGHLNFLGGNSSQGFAHPPSAPASSVPTSPAFPPGPNGPYGYQHNSHQAPPPPAPYYPEQRRPSQPYAALPPSMPAKLEKDNVRPEPIKLPSISDLKSHLPYSYDDYGRNSVSSTAQHSQSSYSPTSAPPSRSQSYASISASGILPPPPGMFSAESSTRAGQKRAHSDVFGATDYDLGPRRNGSRDSGETEDLESHDLMAWTRAGGGIATIPPYR